MRQRPEFKHGLFECLLAAVCCLLLPAHVQAQVLYGSIVGNVKDASDAPIPGAAITITNKETNQSRQTATNEVGGYNFSTVQAGTYEIKAIKDGFATGTRTDVLVTINSVTRVDMALQVGAVSESVFVGAEAGALQTDRSEVRSEMVSHELENLPVAIGRNYQQLFRTLPGFNPPENAHSVPSNPSRALIFNVNGASVSSNNTRLDGASSTNVWLPHVTAYVPALESIETVNVVSNSFDAEQGLAGGASINVQIKTGGNDLHGSAFEYHSDQHIMAKPFFNPPKTLPKYVYNQFGGAIGGPIKKDKLFYFVSYEGTYDRENKQRYVTVATAAIKSGDMSGSSTPMYDPLTGDDRGANRTPFPNKLLPPDRISAISRKIADLVPLPNVANQLTNNYFASAPFIFDRHTADTKVNYTVSDKLTLFNRFSVLHYDSYNRQVFGDAAGGQPIGGGNPGYGNGNTFSLTSGGTYILSPGFIIDAYFGWTRMNTDSAQPRLDEKVGLDILGIRGTNGTRRFEGGWPRVDIRNYAVVGINETFMPYFRRDPQYQYVSNFNWNMGAHSVRFGFDLYHQALNHTQPEFPNNNYAASGGFRFDGGPTLTRGGPSSNQYNTYATFLLGLPTRMGKLFQVPDVYHTRVGLYSLYIRDRWDITPRLTLSYGTRWEYFPMPTRGDRGMERYDPDQNKMLICGVGSVPSDCGVHMSKKMFGPRVGVAWRATNTFVVRGGYGITNDPFSLAGPLRTNHPLLLPLEIAGPSSFQPAGRLETGLPPIATPSLGNGIIDIPSDIAATFIAPGFKRGYVQSWNLTLEKRLGGSWTAQAAYVATREVRHLALVDINAGQIIGAGEDGRPLNVKWGRTADTIMVTPVGTTQYNALQTRLERRFSAGLQMAAHYTWSKTMGIAGVNYSDDFPDVPAQRYFRLNRARTDYDRPHNLELTSIWEPPFGRGKRWLSNRGVLSWLIGGWQVNNILSFISGDPIFVDSASDSLDMPGSLQTFDLVTARPNKIGGAGPGQKFYDPRSFAPVEDARFGTLGFNALRNPGIVNWDFGVFREFRISERWNLQFRMESFNFSNTPHFASPDADISSDSFMEISSTRAIAREGIDQRQFRFGIRIGF